MVTKGEKGGSLGLAVWDYTTIYKVNKQQGPTV